MGAFETFIESNYFFPFLIGVLILLIIIFIIVLIIDRKKEKQYAEELRKELGELETKTIQIPVSTKKVVVKKEKEESPKFEEKEEKEEITLEDKLIGIEDTQFIELPKKKKDDNELDLTSTVEPIVLKENPVNKKIKEERNEIAEDAPVVDLKVGDTNSDESLEATQVIQIDDSKLDDEEVKVEEVKQIEEEGEEIEAPEAAIQLEDEGTSVIDISKTKDKKKKKEDKKQTNAFDVKADGNTDINDDIKYEKEDEFVGNKTEVLDLSEIQNEYKENKTEVLDLSDIVNKEE